MSGSGAQFSDGNQLDDSSVSIDHKLCCSIESCASIYAQCAALPGRVDPVRKKKVDPVHVQGQAASAGNVRESVHTTMYRADLVRCWPQATTRSTCTAAEQTRGRTTPSPSASSCRTQSLTSSPPASATTRASPSFARVTSRLPRRWCAPPCWPSPPGCTVAVADTSQFRPNSWFLLSSVCGGSRHLLHLFRHLLLRPCQQVRSGTPGRCSRCRSGMLDVGHHICLREPLLLGSWAPAATPFPLARSSCLPHQSFCDIADACCVAAALAARTSNCDVTVYFKFTLFSSSTLIATWFLLQMLSNEVVSHLLSLRPFTYAHAVCAAPRSSCGG